MVWEKVGDREKGGRGGEESTAQISQIFKLETKGKSTGTLLVSNLNKCLCHASSTNMDTIVDGLIVYKVANKHCTPSMYILGDYLEIISIAYNYS